MLIRVPGLQAETDPTDREFWETTHLVLIPPAESWIFQQKWLMIQFWELQHTIWLFNIAMENGPFIDGLPIKNGDFPWLC